MADDGFHEVQLGKKQLVFFFMAAAVTLVVVFLMGVWVGKSARRVEGDVVAEVPTADVTPDTPQPPTQVAAGELDYTARLQTAGGKTEPKADPKAEEPAKPTEAPTPAAESGAQDATAKTPVVAAKPADTKPAPKTPAPETKAAAPTTTPAPAAGTFTLQVGAFGTKKPADALVAQLKKKGYVAYVFTSPGGPVKFKVRVGPYTDRASADAAAAKLKKEEGLSPLVQR